MSKSDSKVIYRPFLFEFLDAAKKIFNIIIFTASLPIYADPILDLIEQKQKYFCERYYREHTTRGNDGGVIKDLEVLKLDLEKTIIVDNIAENFDKQKENGIFIKSFYNDLNDSILGNLIPILQMIEETQPTDVRQFLRTYKESLIESINRGSLLPISEKLD